MILQMFPVGERALQIWSHVVQNLCTSFSIDGTFQLALTEMQLFALSTENKLDGPSLVWRLRGHCFWIVFTHGPFFVLFNRASSSYICGYHSELWSRLHLDVFLSPSSDFHDRILPVFKISKYFSWKNKMPQFKHVIYFLWSIVNKIWV